MFKENIMPSLKDFYFEFYSEINKAKPLYASSEYIDCFTSIMFEYLSSVEEAEEPIVCSYRDVGVQINGFSLSEDKMCLTIYVSHFIDSPEIMTVLKSDITALINRGLNFYRKSVSGLADKIDNSSDAHYCAELIEKNKDTLCDVKITVISNGQIKGIDLKPVKMLNAEVKFQIWDIDRLEKVYSSKQKRDPIIVDFYKYLGRPLAAICGGTFEKTNVFLSVLPGEFLADLYSEFGSKLLERNVRAFLQFKGNVNKGIRNTLIEEPEMFLAYNNGITVTAESADYEKKEDGTILIKSITDMQIVNGGQTTVSLYRAKRDPTLEIDFSKVFVQIKLTVISEKEDMDVIVPKISLYSNNQNKVQTADFSSNDPYHVKMYTISRHMWTIPIGGEKPVLWFYERARGQYLEELSKQNTEAKRKAFKEENPLVTKTDMAKVLCAWEMLPEYVSLGAQKCFVRFTEILKSNPITPSNNYYQHAIAKVILFRKIEKIVAAQKFGGYKANIVAHTYYKLMLLTERKIDLDDIWKKQDISPALEQTIIEICKLVQHHLVYESTGLNISEYSKTNKCKDCICNKIKYELPETMKKELLEKMVEDDFSEADVLDLSELSPEERNVLEEIRKITPEQWANLHAWGTNGGFTLWQQNLLMIVSALLKRGKAPSVAQAETALELLEEGIEKGFNLE